MFFKKRFGQNLLQDREYAKKLVEVADIKHDDIVLEVGAGAGMVTQYLASAAKKIIAIEIDERFISMLQNRFKEEKNAFRGNIPKGQSTYLLLAALEMVETCKLSSFARSL